MKVDAYPSKMHTPAGTLVTMYGFRFQGFSYSHLEKGREAISNALWNSRRKR